MKTSDVISLNKSALAVVIALIFVMKATFFLFESIDVVQVLFHESFEDVLGDATLHGCFRHSWR